jgi:RecA-family ATPase
MRAFLSKPSFGVQPSPPDPDPDPVLPLLPPPLDLRQTFAVKPPPLDVVWPGGPLVGTTGCLVAPGGVGKSWWSLLACHSVACGAAGDILGLGVPVPGPALYVAAEDPVSVIRQRVWQIGQRLCEAAREQAARNLRVVPALGSGIDVEDPEYWAEIEALSRGCRLVILDTLSRVHQRDEASPGEMRAVVARIEALAARCGAAVLYVHHVAKAAIRDGRLDDATAVRGATVLVDHARWVAALIRMDVADAEARGLTRDEARDWLRLVTTKGNYGAATNDEIWYRRDTGGVLVRDEPPEERSGATQPTKERQGRGRSVLAAAIAEQVAW